MKTFHQTNTRQTSRRAAVSSRRHSFASVVRTNPAPTIAPLAANPDGTLRFNPQIAQCGGLDVWISPVQAAKILNIKGGAIYRLLDKDEPFLVMRRPLPRKILISLRSVTAFSEATKDPAFWHLDALQTQLRAKLKQIAENKA
jgi:hypothetical protein